MKYFKKIIGDRIYLSPINFDDAEKYAKWINDKKISGNLGNHHMLFDLDAEKEFLLKKDPSRYDFAIVRLDDDELLGNISIFEINYISQNALIGIFIGEENERNKGYGGESINILLNFGFNTLNLKNIMLKVFSFNENAYYCYKKVGFKEIGRRRKSYFYDGKYYDEIFLDFLAEEFNIK